jgi:hypothetical protein
MSTTTSENILEIAREAQESLHQVFAPLLVKLQQTTTDPETMQMYQAWQESGGKLKNSVIHELKDEVIENRLADFLVASRVLINLAQDSVLNVTAEQAKVDDILSQIETRIRNQDPSGLALELDYRGVTATSELVKIQNNYSMLSEKFTALETSVNTINFTLRSQIDPLEQKYQAAISAYDAIEPSLVARSANMDKLLSQAGKTLLAGSYNKYSKDEGGAADLLRAGAIILMAIAIGTIGWALNDAVNKALSTETAILRVALSLVISVPAAYLARESAKHRQQQYSLRQTALDIDAIDGYIASLASTVQEEIKKEIATKLFAPKTFDYITKEAYPLNVQELINKLIDMMPTKKKSSGKDKPKPANREGS